MNSGPKSSYTLSIPSKYVQWIRDNRIPNVSALFTEKLEETYPEIRQEA